MGEKFNYMKLLDPDSGDFLAIIAELENGGAR
jgi:hypothetical protein